MSAQENYGQNNSGSQDRISEIHIVLGGDWLSARELTLLGQLYDSVRSRGQVIIMTNTLEDGTQRRYRP